MENEFKVGDRVRIAVDELHGYRIIFEKGDAGVVTGIAENGYVGVSFDGPLVGCAFMDCKYLEADKAYDPKTAFLSELKGLLEKYNVCLIAHKTDMPISVYFEGEEEPCVTIGKEVNKGCGVVIARDNIMNYEKE